MTPAHPSVPSARPRRRGPVGDLLRLGGWMRCRSLLSWPVLLFLVLICVPPIALVMLGATPNAGTFDHVAWIFAAYFGIAGMPRPHWTGTRSWMRCPGAGHQGPGGNTSAPVQAGPRHPMPHRRCPQYR
jgi:hypothetical protein